MSNDETSSIDKKALTILAHELVPGMFVHHNGGIRQIRGASVTGSTAIEGNTAIIWPAKVTVVFCDAGGQTLVEQFPMVYEFEVAFLEVFEPGIPEGYVSRKNYKKCYEDALASAEGSTPTPVVNKGSRWRAKRELKGVLLQHVAEGEICTAYAVSKDQSSCRLMRATGSELGNIGVNALLHDFFPVPEESAPPLVREGGVEVKLVYFKPGGKYYSDGCYQTVHSSFHKIIEEVYDNLLQGDNPGLNRFAVLSNDFTTSVDIQNDSIAVPHVITAQALCAEIVRRSHKSPIAYALTASKEALALHERHRRYIDDLLPDELKQSVADAVRS
jgi:hypothetical protein